MRGRAGVILLVLFQVFWLNVVVPGHTRGTVTLPGTAGTIGCAPAEHKSHACCTKKDTRASDRGDKTPTPEQRSRCAVCFFAASLSTPPVVDASLAALGLSDVVPPAEPQSILARHIILPYDGRGPPRA